MSAERPGAPALVAEARRTLLEAVLPTLTGEARIAALMVANALGIAERDLTLNPDAAAEAAFGQLAPDAATLVAAIRAGRWDGHAEAHATLLDAARARVAASRPQALRDDDQGGNRAEGSRS